VGGGGRRRGRKEKKISISLHFVKTYLAFVLERKRKKEGKEKGEDPPQFLSATHPQPRSAARKETEEKREKEKKKRKKKKKGYILR